MDKAHQLLQFLCLWDLYRSSTLLVATIYKYPNSDVPSVNPSKRNSCEPAGGGSCLQAPSTVCARKANSCPESSLPKEVTLFPPFTKGPLWTDHIHLLAISIHSLTMVGPSLAWPTEHHIHLIYEAAAAVSFDKSHERRRMKTNKLTNKPQLSNFP